MQSESLPVGGAVIAVTSGFHGNGCDCLPVGGAVIAVTSGFHGNDCNLSSSAHEHYFIR